MVEQASVLMSDRLHGAMAVHAKHDEKNRLVASRHPGLHIEQTITLFHRVVTHSKDINNSSDV